MHTIWLREHNRIAENLFRIVPGQTDEFYFQHARRIVIAEMQHIIYNEYLPVIIGKIILSSLAHFYISCWYTIQMCGFRSYDGCQS